MEQIGKKKNRKINECMRAKNGSFTKPHEGNAKNPKITLRFFFIQKWYYTEKA